MNNYLNDKKDRKKFKDKANLKTRQNILLATKQLLTVYFVTFYFEINCFHVVLVKVCGLRVRL